MKYEKFLLCLELLTAGRVRSDLFTLVTLCPHAVAGGMPLGLHPAPPPGC